jgi:hypothetical protein
MKSKLKGLFVILLTMAMVITGFTGNKIQVKAADDMITITDNVDLVVIPGQTTHITIPIKPKISYLHINDISVSSVSGLFTFTKPTLDINGTKINDIYNSSATDLEFDVTVDDTAEIKSYPITIVFDSTDYLASSSNTYSLEINLKVQQEKTPAQLTVSNASLESTNIGSNTNMKFTVKNEGEITAKNVYLTMDFGTVMDGNYSVKSVKVGDLPSGGTKDITLPVTILTTASVGKNPLSVNFTYKTPGGTSLTAAYKLSVSLTANVASPNLTVTDMKYGDSLKPGEDFSLEIDLKNTGLGTAKSIIAEIDPTSITQDGIIKNYFSNGISVTNIDEEMTEKVKIPLTVSKYATGGMKTVKVNVTYMDASGNKYTLSETVYVDVSAATTAGTPDIVITKVVQSPEQPKAGDKVTITFQLENKSKVDATDLKIYPDGLTNATFIPVNADPYQYIDKLASGEKKKISIPLMVSSGISEGLNNLTVKYTYTGGEGSTIIPIRNIKNDLGSNSIPKLIISKYSTDTDELKAGTIFNLTYDIYNTNSSTAAKNITVTITQADNVFTVTQGSNSFFINRIDQGESIENTIEMKVKSDATTKAYPLTLTIEYEYDGEKPNAETGVVGVTKTETLNLNAEENARPVVDGTQVTSFNGSVINGEAATLGFNFYNMGKAVLNNVTATVEGDGFTPTGGMLFIGNVDPGSSAYEEIEVTPNMEGTASGTLKISYEDSNGETIEFTQDFTGEVMPATVLDPGVVDGGVGPVMNPDVSIAKADIMPIWAFVIMLLAIFAIFVPVTRKVIINVYKAKLRKKEQEQY